MNDTDIASFAGFGIAVVGAWLLSRIGKNGGRPVVVRLLMVGLFAASTVVSFVAWQLRPVPLNAIAWESADAVITRTEMKRHATTDPPPASGIGYDLVIHYQFEVAGNKWLGHDVPASASNILNKSVAKDRLSKEFAEGNKVTVYYNSADPYNSSLDPTDKVATDEFDPSLLHATLVFIAGIATVGVGCKQFIFR